MGGQLLSVVNKWMSSKGVEVLSRVEIVPVLMAEMSVSCGRVQVFFLSLIHLQVNIKVQK